jgi:hypothetical protein
MSAAYLCEFCANHWWTQLARDRLRKDSVISPQSGRVSPDCPSSTSFRYLDIQQIAQSNWISSTFRAMLLPFELQAATWTSFCDSRINRISGRRSAKHRPWQRCSPFQIGKWWSITDGQMVWGWGRIVRQQWSVWQWRKWNWLPDSTHSDRLTLKHVCGFVLISSDHLC